MNVSIADRVAAIIDDLFGVPPDALTPGTTLQDGLKLDSLSVVELQVAIEDAFDIRLSGAETADVQTYGELVIAVQGALGRQRQAS